MKYSWYALTSTMRMILPWEASIDVEHNFHFIRIIAEYKAKLQHMQIHLWKRISCTVEQCFFFGQNFATWWQNKGGANPRKDFWGKWHKVAVFWGKKVKIATLLTKMEYDLKRVSFRYKTIDHWNIWHSCSSS